MSARPAIFYTIAFFVLLPIYFWIQPSIKPTSELEQKQESLLKLNSIDAVTVASGSESLRFQKDKDGKFYNLVSPPGKFVPHDLMEAMVSLLTSAKSVEVVAEDTSDLAQFGLDHPKSVVTIEAPGQPQPSCNCGFTSDAESIASLTAIRQNLLPYWLSRFEGHELAGLPAAKAAMAVRGLKCSRAARTACCCA